MKESRELTEPHESEIYRAGSWDAIGKFQRVNGEDVLFIELTMEDLNYKVNIQKIHTIADVKTKLGISELPENFLDTITDPNAGLEDNDYVIFVEVDKVPNEPVGQPGTTTVPTGLKQVNSGGKPFFIALHVDGNKDRKYKRKTQAIVTNQQPMRYLLNIQLN